MLKGLGRNIWVKPFKIITTRDLNKEGGSDKHNKFDRDEQQNI